MSPFKIFVLSLCVEEENKFVYLVFESKISFIRKSLNGFFNKGDIGGILPF